MSQTEGSSSQKNVFFSRPVMAGIFAFLFLIILGFFLLYQRYQIIREAEEHEMVTVMGLVQQNLNHSLKDSYSVTLSMALLIDDEGNIKDFEENAPLLLEQYPVIDAVQLVPDGVIQKVYPYESNKVVIGYDILNDPKTRKEASGYGYNEVIESSVVYTTTPTKVYSTFLDYFFGTSKYESVDGAIPLHVSYRSVNQLINGLGRGDTLSESVVAYGILIIGQKRFAEIIKDIKSPERKPLHSVAWKVDLEGRLQGEIL